MATLASATLDLARIVGAVVENAATGGSTTTLIDTNIPRIAPPDDTYNRGTIWFISCTQTDLNGLTAIITDWVQSTTTWTFATQSKTITAGDTYAVLDRDFPRDVLRRSVNQALASLGGLTDEYENASLVTVANQMAYILPSGVYNVKRVDVATSTSSPYDYVTNFHWTEVDGKIRFDVGHEYGTAGYQIRLFHHGQPTEITTDTAVISNYYNPDLLKWVAATYALQWKLGQNSLSDGIPVVQSKLAYAMQMAEMMKQRYPIRNMPRDPKLSMWL